MRFGIGDKQIGDYRITRLNEFCSNKKNLEVGDGSSCIGDTDINTPEMSSIRSSTFGKKHVLIFKIEDFLLSLNECNYQDVDAVNGTINVTANCTDDQMVATAKFYACRFSDYINNGSVSALSCKTSPRKLPPSNLTTKFIIKDEGSDITGTVRLTWQNNGDYSGIEIERATTKDYTDWTKIASVSGSEIKYSDELNDDKGRPIQLPEDNEGYRIRAMYPDGTYSAYSDVSALNNCVSLSPQPAMNNIIFRREDNVKFALKYITKQLNSTIDYFSRVDPYKRYFSTFEFRIDLKQLKNSDLSYTGSRVSFSSGPAVKSTSSCKNNARTFISLVDNPGLYYAWTDVISDHSAYIYMNVGTSFTNGNGAKKLNDHVRHFSDTIFHELGHALGFLNDEYVQSGDWWTSLTSGYERENCAFNPVSTFSSNVDGLMYGAPASNKTLGCGVATSSLIGIYRPAPSSIMEDNTASNSNPASTKFNVISCGYLIAGILMEPTDKAHAEKYWPACMKMDTVKDGIPQATLDAYK